MAALVNLRMLALAVLPLFGQTLEIPSTTLVFHSASRSLRPIIGMPGSSYLGPALYADLDFASVAPDQKTTIIESTNRLTVIRNQQDSAVIENAIAAIDRIIWSDDSSTAILFSSVNRQVQWVVNSKAESAISLPDNVRLLAAQADARAAIIAAAGRVYRITPESAPIQIAVLGDPTAATFNGETLYIADTAAHQIFEISNNAQLPFLGLDNGIEDPAALRLSEDGATLYVALKSTRTLNAYRISDKTLLARISLDWEPSSFEALTRNTFLLNPGAKAGEPFSVLSTRDGLAESFIPTGDVR